MKPTTPYQQLQSVFWQDYTRYVRTKSDVPVRDLDQCWNFVVHPLPRADTFIFSKNTAAFSQVTLRKQPELRVELVLDSSHNSKNDFSALKLRERKINNSIGLPLEWYNPTDKRVCRIFTSVEADFRKRELWDEQHKWLLKTVEKFRDCFVPILREIDR